MANSSPLAGLLDRADELFDLAGQMGRAFFDEHERQVRRGHVDSSVWKRHSASFEVFCDKLLHLRNEWLDPLNKYELVTDALQRAGQVAESIRDSTNGPEGRSQGLFVEFFPDLNGICKNGRTGVKLARKTMRTENQSLSNMDGSSAALEVHVTFLERVLHEVQLAVEAKRHQFSMGYPNATLESIVRGIPWEQARRACELLRMELPGDTVEAIARLLNRSLTIHTVEQLAEKLGPLVKRLRDIFEGETLVEEEPPDLIELRRWLAIDGVKGFWIHNLASAAHCGLEIDARHRNIAFLVRQVFAADAPAEAIHDHLFRSRGILPADQVDLAMLEKMLADDARRITGATNTNHNAGAGGTNQDPSRADTLPLTELNEGTMKKAVVEPTSVTASAQSTTPAATEGKQKRSTVKGEGREKLIAGLNKHHKYADGSALNQTPIGNNVLARLADVSDSTASAFFNKEFNKGKPGGYGKYRMACQNVSLLVAALKLLNAEFAPHDLFWSKPPGETDQDDE